ncbi:hypothetical protein WA026_022830 [Henosepilachna vigintioctopunctata]|uniref:B box-type domain-containing protein n=1 Tax=Henosepilachna vigintioctopunctata TaxID=420089 RepID=A0AAW1V429_9CUCU
MECYRCKKTGTARSSSRTLFECDKCEGVLCADCSGLSASEIKVLQLQKRKLMYYCLQCISDVNNIHDLKKQIIELTTTKNSIEKEISLTTENEKQRISIKDITPNENKQEQAKQCNDYQLMMLEIENTYLKKLIEESSDKNNILKQNNQLLLERMNYKQVIISGEPKPYSGYKVDTATKQNVEMSKTYANTVLSPREGEKFNTVKDTKHRIPENCKHSHNSNTDSTIYGHGEKLESSNQASDSSRSRSKEWTTVSSKKKKSNLTKVGTGKQMNPVSNIHGAIGKKWLEAGESEGESHFTGLMLEVPSKSCI